MIGKIDDIIIKKYDDVKVPEGIFDLSAIREKVEREVRRFKIITCIMFIITMLLTICLVYQSTSLKKSYDEGIISTSNIP